MIGRSSVLRTGHCRQPNPLHRGRDWPITEGVRQLRDAMSSWSAADLRLAGATLVSAQGSTPHQLGLSLVTSEAGETVGALSGGCVDADVVLACDRVLAGGPAEVLIFGTDDGDTTGLACGGVLTVWVHELEPAAISAILGASDAAVLTHNDGRCIRQYAVSAQSSAPECGTGAPDPLHAVAAGWLHGARRRADLLDCPAGGQMFVEAFGRRGLFVVVGSSGYTEALCAQAELLGYQTVVIEPRPRFAAGITCAGEVIGSWPDAALEKLDEHGRLDDRSAIVICTHDPKFDEPALTAALNTPAGFIGALGSRATSAGRFERLRARGVPQSDLDRIHSPVGLDLGGASPAETAVSVAAQIIAVAGNRSAAPLRDTSGPLHAR
ncbi:MAG: XdhC family protein [Mycobacterium sp.]|nr:XdhC family protein [Mycobacterium sp.]